MTGSVVVDFQKVTKYPIVQFIEDYNNFMDKDYPEIDRYFSGEIFSIENSHLIEYNRLRTESKTLLAQFENFTNKLSTCGYWELLEIIEEISVKLEKISKLPKYRRTSLGVRGYASAIRVKGVVGGFTTVEDLANKVTNLNGENTDWIDLMLQNDLSEIDWEIDGLTSMDVLVNNKQNVIVTTVLDQPIGERVYGIDLDKKVTFEDSDLKVKKWKDNLEQKCNILMALSRGDVPENMLFGVNASLIRGITGSQVSYPVVAQGLQDNFLQNDLFQKVDITDITVENGTMTVSCEIKTKYDYKTLKKITIET